VELQARFDEEANIHWARALEAVGARVVYGLPGLKTHCKACLVVRQEADGIRRYCHVATGNYNARTGGLYGDLGLFTCRESFGEDLTALFNFLTGSTRPPTFTISCSPPSICATGWSIVSAARPPTPRNLDHRVEIAFPILDPVLQNQIRDILETQLADTVKARRILADGGSERIGATEGPTLRSQARLYEATGGDGGG
jgi:polyphosphate kinase